MAQATAPLFDSTRNAPCGFGCPPAKVPTRHMGRIVPIPEVAGIENFSQNVNQFTRGRPGPAHRSDRKT